MLRREVEVFIKGHHDPFMLNIDDTSYQQITENLGKTKWIIFEGLISFNTDEIQCIRFTDL